MADFLATSIAYYIRAVVGAAAGRRAPNKGPFGSVLRGVDAFLEEALAAQRATQQREDAALAAALQQQSAQLQSAAESSFVALTAEAAVLLPLCEAGAALPHSRLCQLNTVVEEGEAAFGSSLKTEAIPEQLLASSEPGSKLYANLVRKVQTLCSKSFEDMKARFTELQKANLLKGSCTDFDARRSQLRAELGEELLRLVQHHVDAFSGSDHLPVEVEVPGAGSIACWNVLEFPCTGADRPVMDGVNPYVDALLRTLGRSGADARGLLRDAFASEAAVKAHKVRILTWARERSADVVLVQELNAEVQSLVEELCAQRGWHASFSSAGSKDPGKCSAITGVISGSPFDEATQFPVLENKKERFFAAVRRGPIWLVSCHVPLGKEQNEAVCLKVLRDLATRFLVDGCTALVAGGDWNADVQQVLTLLRADLPERCAEVSLHTLCGPSTLDVDAPIDGVFCLRAAVN